MENLVYVHLEIKRIQTYLFSVPKLKAIIGANVILGETTMGTKKDLDFPGNENFVQLAVKHNLDTTISKNIENSTIGYFNTHQATLKDDSPIDFAKKGIVSRHGGHFSAFFETVENAENFIKDAKMLIFDKLPGAMLKVEKIKLNPNEENLKNSWEDLKEKLKTNSNTTKSPEKSQTTTLAELPVFAMCEGSGNEPAEKAHKSKSYNDKIKAADRFYENNTKDIVGMMMKQKLNEETMLPKAPANDIDFNKLQENSYMAVIHADGNNMGGKSSDWTQNALPKKLTNDEINELSDKELCKRFINSEFLREAFFYSMRKATRNATVEAIKKTELIQDDYRLLMSGGDDLFIVMKPKKVFEFIKNYACKIEKNQLVSKTKGKIEEKTIMSIGAGIVIAHHKLPIIKLHKIAEELASNAKKRNQFLKRYEKNDENHEKNDENHEKNDENHEKNDEKSVVDWIVASESFIGEVDEYREKNAQFQNKAVDETCYLTMKPYDILGKENLSLESLTQKAKELKKDDGKRTARNKYKGIVDDLKQGSVVAKILYDEMPEKETFDETKKLFDQEEINFQYWPYVIFENYAKKSFTCIPDIVELAEIDLLGKTK